MGSFSPSFSLCLTLTLISHALSHLAISLSPTLGLSLLVSSQQRQHGWKLSTDTADRANGQLPLKRRPQTTNDGFALSLSYAPPLSFSYSVTHSPSRSLCDGFALLSKDCQKSCWSHKIGSVSQQWIRSLSHSLSFSLSLALSLSLSRSLCSRSLCSRSLAFLVFTTKMLSRQASYLLL